MNIEEELRVRFPHIPDIKKSLAAMEDVDKDVAVLIAAGFKLPQVLLFVRAPKTMIRESYNRQTQSSRFDRLADCHKRGLTAKEAALELGLKVRTVKEYPFDWPRDKTHNPDGSLVK
jgi:DNA-binding NarL/FixJ family response regulator